MNAKQFEARLPRKLSPKKLAAWAAIHAHVCECGQADRYDFTLLELFDKEKIISKHLREMQQAGLLVSYGIVVKLTPTGKSMHAFNAILGMGSRVQLGKFKRYCLPGMKPLNSLD